MADGELIRLCAQFDAIEREHYSAFMAANEKGDAQDIAMAAMAAAHCPLIARIEQHPPTTLAGAVALAESLWQWTHGDFANDHESTDDRLARALVIGLARRG